MTTKNRSILPPRRWYNLEQAAAKLSRDTGEPVTIEDILHYAKIGYLEIGVLGFFSQQDNFGEKIKLNRTEIILNQTQEKIVLDYQPFNLRINLYNKEDLSDLRLVLDKSRINFFDALLAIDPFVLGRIDDNKRQPIKGIIRSLFYFMNGRMYSNSILSNFGLPRTKENKARPLHIMPDIVQSELENDDLALLVRKFKEEKHSLAVNIDFRIDFDDLKVSHYELEKLYKAPELLSTHRIELYNRKPHYIQPAISAGKKTENRQIDFIADLLKLLRSGKYKNLTESAFYDRLEDIYLEHGLIDTKPPARRTIENWLKQR